MFPELEVLSDGNATLTEEEHAGALNTFMTFFGDVLSTDEVITGPVPVGDRGAT